MATRDREALSGEQLVKEDLITREDLDKALEREQATGTPWYKSLVGKGKVTWDSLNRIEFHPKSARDASHSLGKTLVEVGVISEAQLDEVLASQKKSGRLLGNLLLDKGYVTNKDIAKALALQSDLDYGDLDETPSEIEALEAVPEHLARKHQIVPISLDGDRLSVMATSPQVISRMKNLGVLLGKRIRVQLTASEDILSEIRERYKEMAEYGDVEWYEDEEDTEETEEYEEVEGTTEEAEEDTETKEEAGETAQASAEEMAMTTSTKDAKRFENIARAASGASVMKMVSTIIEGAANAGATDIHLDPQEPEMRVRYRIDGVLHDVMSIPRKVETAVVSRVKILADLDITETRRPQDGHISMDIGDEEFDIRVATLPTFLGERTVMRLLDQSSVLTGIRDLGLEKDDVDRFKTIIQQPYGMILVTGPTGSGKTTTLYAALNQKNVMTDSIVTLEDPVEYQLSGINQVQIDTEIGMTFANTLRASLRQDIDVLLVGEIRDAETARIAIRAAMTGHLVFSTLHTNDAPEAVSTLRNMEIPSYLISSALTCVMAQRLVRTICADCKEKFKPSAALLKSIGLPASTKTLYRGAGCEMCYNTGNKGRTGIFELLEITPEVRKLVAEDAAMTKIQDAAKLNTMAMRCREKVRAGRVNAEEFLRIIRT